MKLPNMEAWCDKFLVAMLKNMPDLELDLTADEAVTLADGTLRHHIRRKYGDKLPLSITKPSDKETT